MRIDLFAVQREELRSRLAEATAARFSASEITRWINLASEEFQMRSKILTRNKSFSTVAAQQRYTLPQDYLDAIFQGFDLGDTHTVLERKTIQELMVQTFQSANPYWYAINESPRESWLYPVPSAAATSTTLNGSLTATATTVTVTSTTGFPTRGRFLVDSEVIYYTGTTSTTFTGCTRGYEDTPAVSHSTAVAVTHRDVEFAYYPLPRHRSIVYTTGTITATYASATVTGVTTAWAAPITAAGMFFGVGTMGSIGVASTTFPVKWYEISSVVSTTSITLVDTFQEATTAAGSAYIITELCDIPRRYCGAVIEIAMMFSKMKDDDPATVPFWNDRVNQIVKEAIGSGGLPPDYLPVSRSSAHISVGLPQYPSNYPPRYY